MSQLSSEFLQAVAEISQFSDAAAMQKYQRDYTVAREGVLPLLVLRPKNTEEVVQIVKACRQFHQKYVVQGGLTGLAAGATVQEGEVVITLDNMTQIEEIDDVGGTVVAQAGVILHNLTEAVQAKDWYFPLDLGARGSCTIGGNVSTNAGGNRVLRYGTTRELVLGLEVVLPDGTVLNMLRRMLKNNTGMDLKHLFIGTEGRYGIITRVVLRLFPKPQARQSALMAFKDFDQLVTMLKFARQQLVDLSSFEVMWDNYLIAASQALEREAPFNGQYPLYALVETEGLNTQDFHDRFMACAEAAVEQGLVEDLILPHSIEQTQRLWDIRDAIGKLIGKFSEKGLHVAYDVSFPLKNMKAFVHDMEVAILDNFKDAHLLLFGHLGDGNLHPTITGLKEQELHDLDQIMSALIVKYEGSITAEHGVGILKKPYLSSSRSAPEIAIQEALRKLLNSDNLLNQGRVLD
ncbi:FAD-binding oxidoreductase [Brackiella oedipodis]|uniref:FAD-binding oxidoreductase n=1 Tax=Brackiella oedipodis TaxID=124225 RepID=UPI00049016E8|nr:FAD-binding oxidoreductase [Brackiella oedipodis]